MPNNRLVIFLLLVLIAAGTRWWLLRLSGEPDAPPLPVVRAEYSLQDFELWLADDQGNAQYRVAAPKLTQRARDDQATIEAPELDLFRDSQVSWRLRAEQATVTTDRQHFNLVGETSLTSAEQRILTADVAVDQLSRTAQTTAPARIERAADWARGDGLKVDLAGDRIELIDNVSAYYATPSP